MQDSCCMCLSTERYIALVITVATVHAVVIRGHPALVKWQKQSGRQQK